MCSEQKLHDTYSDFPVGRGLRAGPDTELGSALGHKEQGLKRKLIPKGLGILQRACKTLKQSNWIWPTQRWRTRARNTPSWCLQPIRLQPQSHGFKSHFTGLSRPFVRLLSAARPGNVLVKNGRAG